jgi:hypothetical protein
MVDAAHQVDRMAAFGNGDDALGDVLAKIADALQIAGDADGRKTSRRSLATGWRWAMMSTTFSSSIACASSSTRSSVMTFWASWMSDLTSARMEFSTMRSARPPISAILCARNFMSSSNAVTVWLVGTIGFPSLALFRQILRALAGHS